MRKALLSLLVLATCFACNTADTLVYTQAGKIAARTGVVVVPRNFPKFTADDLTDMFRLDAQLGSFAVMRLNWNDPNRWDSARTLVALSDRQGLDSVLEFIPFKANELKGAALDPPKDVIAGAGGRVSLTNPVVADAFGKGVLEFAQLKPAFLGLGADVNLLALSDRAEFDAFAALYRTLYPRIKQISPATRVFVAFQWEAMTSQAADANRQVVDAFRPRLDLAAFVSEPRRSFAKPGPSAIPPDYYAPMSRFAAGLPIFIETQWPSDGSGGEANQVTFIRGLPRLMASVRPAMVAWSLLHDVRVLAIFAIRSGLITSDGTQKPAFAAFRDITDDRPSRSERAAEPSTTASRGEVSVASRAPDHFGIYMARLDGTDVRPLITSPDREMTHPRISPDGKRITFVRYNSRGKDGRATEDGGYENTEVMVMNLDGTGLESVVPPKRGVISSNGCWSPDGRSLIYISTDGTPAIRQIDLATRRITQAPIPSNLGIPADPHWERTKLVFPIKAQGNGADALWIVNADGTGAHQITHPTRSGRTPGLYGDFDPQLSPDESKVAFMRINGGTSWRQWVLDLVSGQERQLSPDDQIEGLAQWSSDGRLLVFRHIDFKNMTQTGIWRMRPDGGDRRMVPLPRGYLYNHPGFFPGDGSSDNARIVYSAIQTPGM